MKSFKEILMEMPQIIGVRKPALWEVDAKTAFPNHVANGDVVSEVDGLRTTMLKNELPRDQVVHFARQYQVHGDNKPKLHADFKNHSIGDKRGSYSSKLFKLNDSDSLWGHIKSIYDRELSNHDYLISDAHQYEGGRHVWKKLTKEYEDSGKQLYLHDGNKLSKVSHQTIMNGHHLIWGDEDRFENVRLVVSHDPLH